MGDQHINPLIDLLRVGEASLAFTSLQKGLYYNKRKEVS